MSYLPSTVINTTKTETDSVSDTSDECNMLTTYLLLFCAILTLSDAKTVMVGQTSEQAGVRLVGQRIVERNPLPFIKRTDELFFEVESPYFIKGIAVRDVENGLSESSITSGGLGFNFVKIKLKSERGAGYKYMVEIFA